MRIENLELRRKLDELETEKTQIQQKHLSEVRIFIAVTCHSVVSVKTEAKLLDRQKLTLFCFS